MNSRASDRHLGVSELKCSDGKAAIIRMVIDDNQQTSWLLVFGLEAKAAPDDLLSGSPAIKANELRSSKQQHDTNTERYQQATARHAARLVTTLLHGRHMIIYRDVRSGAGEEAVLS